MDSCNAFALGTCHGVGFQETWLQNHRGRLSIMKTFWRCLLDTPPAGRDVSHTRAAFMSTSRRSCSNDCSHCLCSIPTVPARTLWAVSCTLRLRRHSMLVGLLFELAVIGSIAESGLSFCTILHNAWPALLQSSSSALRSEAAEAICQTCRLP